MSISRALMDGLAGRAPFSGGVQRVEAAEPGLASIQCDFVAADRCGCAILELEFRSSSPGMGKLELNRFADDLCKRVNYLMEPLRLVELDGKAGALVLSDSPRRKGDVVGYYHLHAAPTGVTTMHRIEYTAAAKSKTFSPFTLTHEQLERLVEDFVALQTAGD